MCYSGEHLPPHVHVFYNGKEVLIDLVKLNVYAGSLPSRPLKKVIQLVVEHQADLMFLFLELNTHLRKKL